MKRRRFLQSAGLGFAASGVNLLQACAENTATVKGKEVIPIVVSTWNDGIHANAKAWEVLKNGGSALDAVEKGVMYAESDPTNSSVGYGGLPDRNGIVTLDACIMDHEGNAGSVCALENIEHAISVARMVMEKTPHVILAGDGAEQFALENGFEKKDLLSESARKQWQDWLKTSDYKPVINIENHDTIGMLSIDKQGNMSGACTTSGLAFKIHGRVGDSPIIGAGLFVDNEVGGAVCTGLGEFVLRNLSSFLAVEQMRMGKSPQEAAEIAIKRIIGKHPERVKDVQVGLIAMNKSGEIGYYAIHPGFTLAKTTEKENIVLASKNALS